MAAMNALFESVCVKKSVYKIAAGLFVLVVASVYYYSEVDNNWEALKGYVFRISPGYLFVALLLVVVAYLFDVYIWRLCLDSNKGGCQVRNMEIVSIMGISDMLRYIPGRIWGMAAQYYMLKSYCISKSEVVYINLICMIGSVFVSLYLVLVYFAFYSDFISANVAIVLLLVLFSINAAYIFWNSVFMNWIITFLNSFATFKLRPFFYSRGIMLNMQLLYVLGALLAGLSGYCLLKGVGLPSSSGDTLILLVSINVSWLISHFVVVAPRGLGVREGTMLWMLNKVVSVETALLFPILFRVLISLVDLLFVVIALCVGWRNGAFRGGQVEVSKNYDQD